MLKIKDKHPLFLGIDAGGTHCRVRLENNNGDLLGTGLAKTGHPSHGMEVVESNVLQATDMALKEACLPQGEYRTIVAGGGYAGTHLARYHNAVSQWNSPFLAHYVTTDLQATCYGALGGESGGVIIAGTGFSAMSLVNGRAKYISGQGFLLGDMACGSWLGLQAVKLALAYRDDMAKYSEVVSIVESTFAASGAELADKMILAQPNEFARCAKDIFDAADNNDAAACLLVQQAARDCERVVNKLIEHGCEKIAIYGSVGHRLKNTMSEECNRYFAEPLGSAEQGAILFAKKQYGLTVSHS